ncbi:hypothetical protein KC19_8G003100 [Ceratodon purpureus]|uniref:Exonuclease V n=1 Tax=Ceratodon purpureus TaxID=3225 RepID=A0A8T0GVZ0_CERPU|nr:hypothetical protein KC19_8G003100 [Ceratodon purpureus]
MEAASERAMRVDDSITIEIVDDDELAAIEAAFLQVSSKSQLSKPFASSAIYSPPLKPGRQCSNLRSSDGGPCSVSHLEIRSKSGNPPSSRPDGHGNNKNASVKCGSSSELVSVVDEPSSEVSIVKNRATRVSGRVEEPAIAVVPDVEDLPGVKGAFRKTKEEEPPPEPKPRCLSVTDFTAFEWCEKQVEFTKLLGKPKQTEAMRAGSARHAELEIEVLKKVEVEITSDEDTWAMKLIDFITGARQMQTDGMTRELPVVGLIGGAWVVGIVDELKMCDKDGMHRPQLIDTKTRNKPTPPSPPQKRNGRMQLMVYKCLWDNIVTSGVPFDYFFEHFRLRPQHLLSEDIRVHAAEIFPDGKVQNLQDVARMYTRECVTFPESHGLLLLRYEWQAYRSLLGQDEFDIEREWLDLRIGWHLEFWHGLREPAYVPDDETWKCRYCAFAELCPAVEALNLGTEAKREDEFKKPREERAGQNERAHSQSQAMLEHKTMGERHTN